MRKPTRAEQEDMTTPQLWYVVRARYLWPLLPFLPAACWILSLFFHYTP